MIKIMKIAAKIYYLLAVVSVLSCSKNNDSPVESIPQNWVEVKNNAEIENHLPDEFGEAEMLPLSTMGTEDGLFVTRDGLDLYCIYLPCDYLSFQMAGFPQTEAENYLRGPLMSMDLYTTPDGYDVWIHADIYHANRISTDEAFSTWKAVSMADPIVSEGAPQGVGESAGTFDYFVYQHQRNTEPWDDNIWLQTNVDRNLASQGVELPAIINTQGDEDDPHIEKIGDTLLLFYERLNYEGNYSPRDIWYTTSADEGITWSNPINVAQINQFFSVSVEHYHPHLFFEQQTNTWFLYFTTMHTDEKLAIYRCAKGENWVDWSEPELVLSAGNTVGIGEPTLTSEGDLYFVVYYENPNGTAFDKYDGDPWMIKRLGIN